MNGPMETFISICANSRFTFYETWFNKTIVIVEEKFWEGNWSIKKSISLPKKLFSSLQFHCNESLSNSSINFSSSMNNLEEPFSITRVYDRFELPLAVRELLFDIDCQNVPITENQLGCMSDYETLEWYWDIKCTPESPDEAERCPSPKLGDKEHQLSLCETPIKSQNESEKTCPPAPKKLRCEKEKQSTFRFENFNFTDF